MTIVDCEPGSDVDAIINYFKTYFLEKECQVFYSITFENICLNDSRIAKFHLKSSWASSGRTPLSTTQKPSGSWSRLWGRIGSCSEQITPSRWERCLDLREPILARRSLKRFRKMRRLSQNCCLTMPWTSWIWTRAITETLCSLKH